MSIRIQNRRDTTTGWNTADPILAAGEIGHNTTLNAFKVGDGTSLWSELDYFQSSANITPAEVGAIALTEKGAALGVAELDSNQNVLTKTGVVFEGATADAYETTLAVTDPTADRTITLPNTSGTVALTSDLSSYIPLSTFDAKGDLLVASADNTVAKLTAGTNGYILTANSSATNGVEWAAAPISLPSQTGNSGKYLTTDGSTASWGTVDLSSKQDKITGVSDTEIGYLDGVTSAIQTQLNDKAPISSPTFTGTVNATDLTLSGNLTVNGTTTNINSTNLVVEDKNIVIGDTTSPTDTTADGGGITLKGTTDKTLNWVDATDSWTSSEHIDLATGKVIKVAGTQVLSSTQYTGNAATVTNGVYTTGTYSDPSWITSLAASKVGLGNVENTALSTWAGSTNITTLGTVATGTWSATTIALNKGGTGATTQAGAANAVLPSQTSNSGKYLTTDGTNVSWGTVSSYSAPTLGSTSIASGATVSNVNGLTINSTTIPTSKTLVVTTDKISVLAATTSAELAGVISDETGSGALVFATSPTISLPSIDNPRYGYTTTATAAGTTTLTVSSNFQQFFTGSTTQTVVLPVASTMVLGQGFYIENNATGNLTVNSSGGNLVATVTPGTTVLITNILTSGTTAASWDVDWHGFGTITGTGANVLGTSPTISGLTLTGTLTAGAAVGTSGQVLSSTGTGVQWITPAGGAAFSELMLIGA